jgi:hypothetical protein
MSPEVRIGDDEREAAVRALGDHFAAGRLTKEEFDERSEQAWVARTRSALMPLFADLPRPAAVSRPEVHAERGRRTGWGAGPWLAPVLVVVVALAVLTHLPLFLLLLVGWLLLARSGRMWGPHRHWSGGGPRRTWVR